MKISWSVWYLSILFDCKVHRTLKVKTTENRDLLILMYFAGYGNQTPVTSGGRIFLVIYALFGIPLCAVMLAAIGEKLSNVLKVINAKECSVKHKKVERVMKAFLMPFVGILIFIFIPSIIFTVVEDWKYEESLYYSIVTLTTIGFGDFVIGKSIYSY